MHTFYQVEIQGVTAASPRNGFIDPTKIEQYMEAGSIPATYEQCEAKERANMRYETLIAKLQQFTNIYVTEITTPGANSVTEPSKLTFKAEIEHGDESLVTQDELSPGSYLTGAAALKRAIARSLIVGREDFGETYDPTPSTAPENSMNVPRRGVRIARIEFGALANNLTAAELLVTVTSIPA